MKTFSLSRRLMIAAGLSTAVALTITALAITYLFEVYFQDRLISELRTELVQLTASVTVQEDGTLEIGDLGDLRYSQPFSGRYWQIEYNSNPPVLSRSLWDQKLDLTVTDSLGKAQIMSVIAPFGTELLTISWRIIVNGVDVPDGVVLSVARDLTELNEASAQFRLNIAVWLMLLGTTLLLAAWLQVRVGLKPLEQIRAELEETAYKPDNRLRSNYPSEVRPLVETINTLLDRQAETLTGARRRASDLAHGLKTPLTVLAAHADDIRTDGDGERAAQISSQVSAMRFFVERELARRRVSPSMRESTDLAEIADKMVGAIGKLPEADKIDWITDIPAGLTAPFDAHDLSELLGNLLDNARKYARSRVTLSAKTIGERVELRVEDDGPGVLENELEQIIHPGLQGTGSVAGHGLGLAIVQDMLELNGCKLGFENRPAQGLTVIVSWNIKHGDAK